MKKITYTLTGKIINKTTQQAIGNLNIAAWKKNVMDVEPLATTNTDKTGKFSLQIENIDTSIKKSDLIFKIFHNDELIITAPLSELATGNSTTGMVIPLDLPSTDIPDDLWTVMGHVHKANGEPVAVNVTATNVKLSGNQFLGQVQTQNGTYFIHYKPEPKSPGCNLPDLLVEALLNDKVIASSPIIYNAEKFTAVDLVVGNETYKGPSEYQVLEQTIKPCIGDKDPATLTSENVEFLANKTGANQQWISLYVLAHRQGKVTEAAPPLFYACFRKQLPYSLDKLIKLKSQIISARIATAIDENIIDEEWKSHVADFLAALQSSAIKSALAIDETSTKTSLGKVFTQIKIPVKSQQPLLTLYVKHQDNIPGFWEALGKNKTLEKYAADLKLALKVSALTQHFEPATKAILNSPVFNEGKDISKLTQLSSGNWKQITKSIGTAPETIPGEGEEQLQNYALLMEKTIMSAFPTQHVAANIVKNDKYKNTELAKFFEIAPDFSFDGTNISSYVHKLNGSINDKAAVIKDLSKLQRLFYLAPAHDRYKVMDVLDQEGLGSSLQIRQFGKNAFLNIFGKKLGNNFLAAQVFNKAAAVSATAMNLALQYNDLGSNILPYVLQGKKGANTKPTELDLPDLKSLFGAQSFCSCKHCRSVYSAAAYFVDLLSFLKETYQIDTAASTDGNTVYVKNSSGDYVKGLDLLSARRSDLLEILLNCENTNTVIPYLDIVIEVLENAVLNTSEAYQTTSTSDELKANPEHIQTEVYDEHLAKEIFPFTQPFNLWNEEGNVYMQHLGVPRYEMMDTFQFHGNANEPDNQSKYAVQLNLTRNGKDIITGEMEIDSSKYTVGEFWGIATEDWIERLSKVREFIDKTAISYVQLLEFQQLKFVNATGIVKVKFKDGAPCDIEQAVLAYWDESAQSFSEDAIDEKFFIRAHCFFRLLQKTPWTIFELGRIMDSLGVQNIGEKFIEQAAILLELQEKFKKEPLEFLSWWTDLNTQSDVNDPDDRSFYARHFLNKTVFDPKKINEDPTFVFTLNSAGTELENTGNFITEHLNEIEAALNIPSSDLLLLTETLITSGGEIDDALTLKNLAQLFRIVSLSRGLSIPINEYLIAKDFIVAEPFNADKSAELLSFMEQVAQVKRSGFSFTELQYVLLDQYNSAEGIAPTEDRIIRLFTAMQEGLQKIKAELEVPVDDSGNPVDPTGELCKQKSSMLLEEEGIGYIVSIAESKGPLTPEQKTDAPTWLFFLDSNQLIADFATVAYSSIEARYAYILQGLVNYLVSTQSRSFIIQTLSADLAINLDSAESLLIDLVYSTNPANDPNKPQLYAIEDFLDPAFAYDAFEEGEVFDLNEFILQHNTYLVLYKSALVINKFSLNTEEVTWTFTKGSDIGWLDLNAITGAATLVFSAWLKMENFFFMRKQFAEGDITFFELMDFAETQSLPTDIITSYEVQVDDFISASPLWTDADRTFLIFLSLLSEITGWERDSLFYFASSETYTLHFEDFMDEQAFYQLMKCFDTLNTLRASAQDAWNWMAVDLTTENSANIKQTAKAKYSETEWLKVAAPLRDVLREKQRDALNAYLIQNRDFEDENDLYFEDENALYEYYLLDVETSACTMSSRIVLANSSVQLFIQRHLMNLEMETLDLDADRWEWMKNYRVWEANRKVFLYPENWIEPDLRLNKSEIFADLQNALLQNDVTVDLVETSIKDYLEKLDEISNIEVCGTYHEYEEGDGITADTLDMLHVFGKTSGVPNEYYYRTYVDNSYWTPWTKVNLDIQGKHLIPAVLNNRLYLFWPEFTGNQEEITKNISEIILKNLEGIAIEALENIYSSNWEFILTYDEIVEEKDGVLGIPGEVWADEFEEQGLTQEAVRSTYINEQSIQEYIDGHYNFGTIDYYEIKLAYSEYKEGKWLPKKLSETAITTDRGNLSYEILYGFQVEDVKDKICFHTRIQSDYLEINCTQKLDLQLNGGYTKWDVSGQFKFYFGTKDLSSRAGGVYYPVLEPAGTSIYFNSFREETAAKLELISADVSVEGNYEGNDASIVVLDLTPGTFRIPLLHQYDEFVSQDNFFYGDDYRNFFVKPYHAIGLLNNSLPAYSTNDTTFSLDNYLHIADAAVGIFHETAYDTHGVGEVIFDKEPKDRIDPLPSTRLGKRPHAMMDNVMDRSLKSLSYDDEILSTVTNSLIDPNAANQQVNQLQYLGSKNYRFNNFYHPYSTSFIKLLNRDGIAGLLTRKKQMRQERYFLDTYKPTENVHENYPINEVDFSSKGAMSFYNWELFFHIPMLIAGRLSQNQQFEDAQKWYHYIFNPLDRSSEASPNKFWQFKPFFELYGQGEGAAEDSVYNLMFALSYTGTDADTLDKKAEVEQQIDAWLASPFDPYAIAALRPVAYMKSIVMKYIDNLIAWGDFKFQQDTIESINEATQVYILAAQILGKRPELIPVEETEARSYNELIAEVEELDSFSNALVTLENFYGSESLSVGSSAEAELLPKSLYFCIPNNPNLLGYWDTVEERLFKIRHCMNIEGVVRQLPLFQPPIDPGLLVKARAAGLSIGSVLNDLYAPLPHYRYRVMVQKALEFCADVKTLGNALLSILEKKDAEEMSLLRAGHELKLLQVMQDVKKLQLDEVRENLSALQSMRKITVARHDYYKKIEKINSKEKLNLDKLEESRNQQKVAEKIEMGASQAYLIPNVTVGMAFGYTFGGINLGATANAIAASHRNKSVQLAFESNKAAIIAGYTRRWDDWKLQEKLASRELDQIDKQITAAEIRVAIMEKEIANHNVQIENSREVSDFMVNKFTNKELYDWMTGQLSTVYFQSYQMAYDLAKRAQKSLQYELGTDQTFIQFGYWDSLKKGLLAGDKLHYDIRRMEVAYLDQTKRSYELTKSISLTMLDPMALVQLRETGTCYINLPEVVYDLDYAGQYMRRIRSVQLTLPCVTGPYTSINCKLTLLDNKWRKDTSGDYVENQEDNDGYDPRFVYNTGGTQSIATSSGQNDSGMFQLNFNDERYLPFEGAGAISNWRLEIPSKIRSFDFNTISDVIMHLNYTAKDGGDLLKQAANEALESSFHDMVLGSENQGLTRMFSLKHEFANEWYRFLNPPEDQDGQSVLLNIGSEKFPFMFREYNISVGSLEMIMILDDDSTGDSHELKCLVTMPSGNQLKSDVNGTETEGITLSSESALGGQLYQVSSVPISEAPGDWSLNVLEEEIPEALKVEVNGHSRFNPEVVKDLIIIVHYSIT